MIKILFICHGRIATEKTSWSLRSTIEFIKCNLSVETLKYLMGHTDISVTSNVYTHLKLEDAQREMERLERIEKEMKKCAK